MPNMPVLFGGNAIHPGLGAAFIATDRDCKPEETSLQSVAERLMRPPEVEAVAADL